MSEQVIRGQIAQGALSGALKSQSVIGLVCLIFGVGTGVLYGRYSAAQLTKDQLSLSAKEIVVPKDGGLLFKSEDGTPLARIGKDSAGSYMHLLSPNGKPVVELNNLQDRGGIIVGSKNGGFAYIQAQDDSATITLIGKYGKEALQMTSATTDGGGNVQVNEGKKGYKAVEIGAGSNRVKSKGTIVIPGDTVPAWQAP